MKRLIAVTMMLLIELTAAAKEDWKGKVVDANGEPVAYANVAVLSRADSTVVCGAVTQEDGTFNIVTNETDGIMMVVMLGYQTQYLTPMDGMLVTLLEDTQMLEGASIAVVMPKTKLTGEGIQTSVRGSVLENVGNANDVLAKTPGIIKGQNGIEVIGKGAPLVYINGHKVTDATELQRLQSNEIQSVEVITNPGAQYDATVRSVVRIRTIRRQGDGFGFSINANDAQSLRFANHNDQFGAFNANYRVGGVDFFAGINYSGSSSRQESDLEKASFGKDILFVNKGTLVADYFGGSIYGNAGVNWQLADNHFLGGKIEWGKQLKHLTQLEVNDNVFENGIQIDKLRTLTEDCLGDQPYYNLGGNVYYNGLVGEKLGIDINLDVYRTDNSINSLSKEISSMTQDATIRSESYNTSSMYAAKAVLSYPVWKGQLQAGTEETFTRRLDEYFIHGIDIPASKANVNEGTYAGFASYGAFFPKFGQLSAGVRYEYVKYSYKDALAPANDLTKDYGNFFPTFSYAGAIGPVQLMLNYSEKTTRPNYANLSSAIRYNSRYIWQSGNAQLQPEFSHQFGFTAIWKFVTFMVNYARTDGAIMTWSSPYNDQGVVLVQPRNIDSPFRQMTTLVNLTPTVGPWTLNYTFGLQPQWLTLTMDDSREASGKRVAEFNGNMYVAQLQNTLTVKGGWQFELGGTFQSTGYSGNLYIYDPYINVTAAVQKILMKDGSLVLRLEGEDIFGTARMNVNSDFGSHTISQTNLMDWQRVKLSVRYVFNAAQSKYRGTGAGQDSKNRM
jgi:hypothetical protein